MELKDYPRPQGDNGRGMHWSAGHPLAVGIERVRSVWIPELKALNITWVKMLHDGGLLLAEELLKSGIMPIVRLYRPTPNPGYLQGSLVDALRAYAAIGVRYFEANNEPNLGMEWTYGSVPPNGPRIVAENWLRDAEIIYAAGGYPAVPAPSVGADGWDLVGEIVALGHTDLLRQGAWIAVHNYTLNHPLDYPNDDVNRLGAPLSSEAYLAAGSWAWDGESLEQINARRMADYNGAATIMDDHSCFREFEYYDALCRRHLGSSLPVISTEGGALTGTREDPRYPRVTAAMHSELNAEIFAYMQTQAPVWYFAHCTWLLANFELGGSHAAWESHAWYTRWWDATFGLSGRLPVVERVKAMPSFPRLTDGAPRQSIISGRLVGMGVGVTVTLRATGYQNSTMTDQQGAFAFRALAAGRYRLTAQGVVIKEAVDVDGKNSVNLGDVNLPTAGEPALDWDRRLDTVKVSLVPANAPAGESYFRLVRAVYDASAIGRNYIYCEVQDEKGGRIVGQKLTMSWPGGSGQATTENKPVPEFAANFAIGGNYNPDHGPGPYSVGVDGLPSDKVSGMGRPNGRDAVFYLTWRRTVAGTGVAKSTIRGIVVGGQTGQVVILRAASGEPRQTTLDASGSYIFQNLPAGSYTVEVGGVKVPNLRVDGTSSLDVPVIDLRPRQSAIRGIVLKATGEAVAGAKVVLTSGDERKEAVTDSKGAFQFTNLVGGTYAVEVAGLVQTARVDGKNQVTLQFRLAGETPRKLIAQYLLFGPPNQVGTRANLVLAEDYILKFMPTVGFSVDEAAQATSVLIVGDQQAVSAADEDRLKAAGCQVTRLAGGPYAIEQAFNELVKGRGVSAVPSERLAGPQPPRDQEDG